MKFAKGAISIALALNMVSITAFAASTSFSDVPTTHWAHDSIVDMADRGVIKGIGHNKFAPEGTVTYAEFVTMLTREFYEAKGIDSTGEDWYSPYLTIAQNKHLLQGCKDLAPTDVIDRFDMAQVMYNHMKESGAEIPDGADPSSISDWDTVPESYQEAVAVCYAMGLLQGKNASGKFGGTGTMSRAEAATVVDRLIEGETTSSTPEVPEVPEEPATPEVPEEPAAPPTEVPAGSLIVTDKEVEKIGGAQSYYSDGVFHIRSQTAWTNLSVTELTNPGYNYLTFTVTTFDKKQSVDVVGVDGRFGVGAMDYTIQPAGTTQTYTANVSGMKKLELSSAFSTNYSNCDISNIYFHN